MREFALAHRERDGHKSTRDTERNCELGASDLHFRVRLDGEFATTAELAPTQEFTGQERALSALEIGLGVKGCGFNIFVSGLAGTEKLESLRQWVVHRVGQGNTPGDRVYVHNFHQPDAPRALFLNAGQGVLLKQMMRDLIKRLKEELPKAFRQEAFDKEKSMLREKYSNKAQELNAQFEKSARDKGFQIRSGRAGSVTFVPVLEGKLLQRPDDLAQLSEAQQQQVEKQQQELVEEMLQLAGKQREIMRQMEEDIRLIERKFCENLLNPLISAIEREMNSEKVSLYLSEVKEHILDHLDDFKEGPAVQAPFPFMPPVQERDLFLDYDVNVVVDNSQNQGPPVLVETSPTYLNLFGTIERVVDRFGRVVTNFTRIKSGSVLRAHGGYLIFNLEDAITEPAVWKVLKRTLKSGRIEMETYEPFALFSASGLRPEPVHIDVKVIVVASPFLYSLLYAWDDEFREVFKIRADFRQAMESEPNHLLAYGQWVAKLCREEHLPHFDRRAVERLLVFGARSAGDRNKVSASYAEIADVVREAAYWAVNDNAEIVSEGHVEKALENRVFRSNRIEGEIRELIANGTILIDIDGKKVGQVNGLSVLDIGGYAFGRPSRVTASVAMGQAGIINIERESRLSGSVHDKGVLILSGYLRNRYGQDKPLALSASLCFEQSYSGVEGDSASSAELYALLSRLANVPLRQDIAVTGSVNQWGEIQAIGGVNEKIEGFFDVCRAKGLTGHQGVIIPQSNVRHLVPREDVVRAVEEERFHVYSVTTVDEGLEILTGMRSGEVGEEGTVNEVVSRRLRELALGLKNFTVGERHEGPSDSTLP